MQQKLCVLDETKICDGCGECERCDLDPSKICDNCMKCIQNESDENGYRKLKIDEIILEDGEDERRFE